MVWSSTRRYSMVPSKDSAQAKASAVPSPILPLRTGRPPPCKERLKRQGSMSSGSPAIVWVDQLRRRQRRRRIVDDIGDEEFRVELRKDFVKRLGRSENRLARGSASQFHGYGEALDGRDVDTPETPREG